MKLMLRELRFRFNKLRLVIVRWWLGRQVRKAVKDYYQTMKVFEPYKDKGFYPIVESGLAIPIALMLKLYLLLLISEPEK
jgi:hypothetical protein